MPSPMVSRVVRARRLLPAFPLPSGRHSFPLRSSSNISASSRLIQSIAGIRFIQIIPSDDMSQRTARSRSMRLERRGVCGPVRCSSAPPSGVVRAAIESATPRRRTATERSCKDTVHRSRPGGKTSVRRPASRLRSRQYRLK